MKRPRVPVQEEQEQEQLVPPLPPGAGIMRVGWGNDGNIRLVRSFSPHCWIVDPDDHRPHRGHYHGVRYNPDDLAMASTNMLVTRPCIVPIFLDIERGSRSRITFCRTCVDIYNHRARYMSLGTPESKEWYDLWNLSCRSEKKKEEEIQFDSQGRLPLCVLPAEIAFKIHGYLRLERPPAMMVAKVCPDLGAQYIV